MPDHYAIYVTDDGNNKFTFKVIRKDTAITQDTTGTTTLMTSSSDSINANFQRAVAAVKNNLSAANQ